LEKESAAEETHNKTFSIGLTEKNVKTPVPVSTLKEVAQRTFEVTGMRAGEISLVVCDDIFIAELNRGYRRKNNPTDVLSFSMDGNGMCNGIIPVLGDIIISVQTAAVQARDQGTTIEDEFTFLFIHGLLHLLGYTHDHGEDEKIMMGIASEILSGIEGNL